MEFLGNNKNFMKRQTKIGTCLIFQKKTVYLCVKTHVTTDDDNLKITIVYSHCCVFSNKILFIIQLNLT